MRFILLLLLLAQDAFALDNAVRIKTKTGGAQTGRPFTIGRWFTKDELCDYPKPYVDGSAPAKWQADRVNRWPVSATCPAGSVQFATISFRGDVPGSGWAVVDFRNSTDPCSSGNQAACDAAGLSTASALTFNSSGWDAQMIVTADPQGSTTAATTNARTMLTDGRCKAWLKGPAVTQYVCGPYASGGASWDTARTYNFGWKETQHYRGSNIIPIDTGDTSFTLSSVEGLTGLSRPFRMNLDDEFPPERVSICYVNSGTKTLYIGTTNGSDSSCATSAGRAQDGTTAQIHYNRSVYLPDAADIRLTAAINSASTTIPVTSTSPITAATIIHIKGEEMRVCNKSGNDLMVGTAAWPCSASISGRRYRMLGTRSGNQAAHSQVYVATASDRWSDTSIAGYKSISPTFVLTFYDGVAGVGIEYILQNNWTDRVITQHLNWQIQRGTSPGSFTTEATLSNRVLGASASWKFPDGPATQTEQNDRKIWTANAPGNMRIDYNIPYMVHSGLLSHDPTQSVTATAIANELSLDQPNSNYTQPAWDNDNTKCAIPGTGTWTTAKNHHGNWQLDMGASAARGDVAPHPRWYLMPLYAVPSGLTNADRLWEVLWGNAACAGYPAFQYIEGTTGKLFCNGGQSTADTTKSCSTAGFQSLDAFGYPYTRDARELDRPFGDEESVFNPIGHWGPAGFANTPGDVAAHKGDMAWLPYMLTGDWYFYRIMQGHASWVTFNSTANPDYSSGYTTLSARTGTSRKSWSVIGHMNGHRGFAMGLREVLRVAVASQDGTPEKEFWLKKVKTNIGVYEGRYNITNGSYYEPCPDPVGTSYDYSYWCFGRHFTGFNDSSLSNVVTYTTTGASIIDSGILDNNYSYNLHAEWMFNYLFHALGDANRQGLTQVAPLRKHLHKRMLNMALNRSAFPNPYMIQVYQAPLHPCVPGGSGCAGQTFTLGTTQLGFSDYAALYQGFAASYKASTTSFSSTALDGGYAQIARSAWAFIRDAKDGAFTGTQAYDHLSALLVPCSGDNLSWCLKPSWPLNIRARATGTTTATVLFDRPVETASCGYVVGTTAPTSTLDSGDTAVPATGAQQTLNLTGLTGATAYRIRITCGASRETATFTTN